ncbi:MAG: VCBS repeat-containing protein [Candidatus Odinarchaeum yellowstonii]|uniref:VCBS repeat-containing protein n=1 Tax=Odinarchaeota yellowstonii (strain LCB_4) TaxID=1841599 RepID=A0AAF0D246_ODILC|nr:MAG: VCBS repeat-containing protein [Candidatus Odinarchaeum yellowstonii]
MRTRKNKILLIIILIGFFIICLQTTDYSIQNQNNDNKYSNYYLPTSHSACRPLTVADINSDGELEILTGTDQGLIIIYQGVNNSYTQIYNVGLRTLDSSIPIGADKIYSIVAGDIDNTPSNIEILIGTLSHTTVTLKWLKPCTTAKALRSESLLEILHSVYTIVKNRYFVPVIVS